ncbi:MAG: AAA family ATPase [Clostridiaceae bacterium]|nr:AAA family ATPase [Clostridiaceae bacterium]
MSGFKKAKREQIWLKVLLAGPSGSGKTYSALRLATGIAKKAGSRIAAIDTENGRIRYYADEFDFDDMQLAEPYSPEAYIKAIDMAVDGGYEVLIIDSISHEWSYCLEVHSKMPGNSYTNWSKITPRHNAFMEKIIQSPIHVLSTVRGKDEYILEEKSGKQVPKKVGKGYRQRDDTEYENTVTFNIDQQTHVAEVFKDNTHLFEGRYEMLTEKDGEALYNWANEGDAPAPRPVREKPKEEITDDERLSKGLAMINDLVTQLVEKGVTKKAVGDVIKANFELKGKPSANYNAIKDVDLALKIYNALKEIEPKKEDE